MAWLRGITALGKKGVQVFAFKDVNNPKVFFQYFPKCYILIFT